MCNFHPALYVWLWENFKKEPEKAEYVHDFLSMAAFTEALDYPCTAKYHLDKLKGVSMMTLARSADNRKLTPYHPDVRRADETAGRPYRVRTRASLNKNQPTR